MTSNFIVGGCVVSFIGIIIAAIVVTEPADEASAPGLIIGSNGDSDVLILTSKSAAVLPPEVDTIVDLWGITPVEFLKALKMERTSSYPYYFHDAVSNWISKRDLPELLALTRSTEPCARVTLMVSSRSTSSGSTVGSSTLGQEALFMIESYREGAYPSATSPGNYSDADAKELTDWCRKEMAEEDK